MNPRLSKEDNTVYCPPLGFSIRVIRPFLTDVANTVGIHEDDRHFGTPRSIVDTK